MKMKELFEAAQQNLSFLGVSLIVIIGIFVVARIAEKMIGMKNEISTRTRKIAVIGIFSAISGVLMTFEIPLWFAPSFYELDFSEVPVLICGFAYGPMAGVIAELCKVFVKMFIKGTSTAFVGDLANYVIGCSLVLPASIIYHMKKTRKAALIGMGVGTAVMAVLGSAFNAFYLIPTYVELFGMPLDAIIGMGAAVNPNIKSVGTLVLFAVAPFNLLKGVADSVITFLLYKKLSPVIHAQHSIEQQDIKSAAEKG